MATAPTSTLIAAASGAAATGAIYIVTVHEDAGLFTTACISGRAAGDHLSQGIKYTGTDREAALLAMLRQFKTKQQGRERQYTLTYPGTSNPQGLPLGPVPTTLSGGRLGSHAQLWEAGQPLDTLPLFLHRQTAVQAAVVPSPLAALPGLTVNVTAAATVAAAGQPLSTAPATTTTTTSDGDDDGDDGDASTTPGAPQATTMVQLCVTAADAAPYLADPAWVASQKVDGRRMQLAVSADGTTVVGYNRAGQEVPLSDALAAAALPFGALTRLDGELVSLDDAGREGLYSAAANRTVFVAFDLLDSPLLRQAHRRPHRTRFATLRQLVRQHGGQQILLVESATSEADKRDLLARAVQHGWEGLVFARSDAAYTHGRGGAYVRFKTRKADIDAVVLRVLPGKGRLAQLGLPGAVEVGLYAADGTLFSIGEVGGGWTDRDRTELRDRVAQGETVVITLTTEGLNKNKQVIRPSGVAVRPAGDKLPAECRWDSETTVLLAPDAA